MEPVTVTSGESPVLLAMPHTGTWLPKDVFDGLNARGRLLADTDWHIDRLYAGLLPGATVVRANFHRYLIDANRDPAGLSLYPGQNTTGLCPLTDFDGEAIWRDGHAPDEAETERRREGFHAAYHAALGGELARLRRLHGQVVLYDCHSIRSEIPFLFDSVLPDLNIGTNDGRACAHELESIVLNICQKTKAYTHILNGRFKGGWTTRRYGRSQDGIHAVQMEIAQSAYLKAEEPPFALDDNAAANLRTVLGSILGHLEAWALEHGA